MSSLIPIITAAGTGGAADVDYYWLVKVDNPSGQSASSIVIDSSHNIYVGYKGHTSGGSNTKPCVVAITPEGDEIWNRAYSTQYTTSSDSRFPYLAFNSSDELKGMFTTDNYGGTGLHLDIDTSDGNVTPIKYFYYSSGTMYGSTRAVHHNDDGSMIVCDDVALLKQTSTGSTSWCVENNHSCACAAFDSDGNAYIIKGASTGFVLSKWNSSGSFQFAKDYSFALSGCSMSVASVNPDGTRIAIIGYREYNSDYLYFLSVLGTDGTHYQTIYETSTKRFFPDHLTWSADGESIFAAGFTYGTYRYTTYNYGTALFKVDYDGSTGLTIDWGLGLNHSTNRVYASRGASICDANSNLIMGIHDSAVGNYVGILKIPPTGMPSGTQAGITFESISVGASTISPTVTTDSQNTSTTSPSTRSGVSYDDYDPVSYFNTDTLTTT